MKKEAEILKQYARADFSKRMDLFLQFPNLRDTFQEIERKRLCCSKGFPVFGCTAEQRGICCATIVPQPDQRDIEIEKIGMDC